MMSLNTAFKKVYGEGLAPYGFKKIKGSRPYFVRMVGDEILQVISYLTRPSVSRVYKEFSTCGGIATVYRPNIDLSLTAIRNSNWLYHNLDFYNKKDIMNEKPNMFDKWYTFSYKPNDEKSLLDAVEYSLEVTKQVMLNVFDEVKDIRTCVEYLRTYSPQELMLFVDETFGQDECNEGLLNFMVYDIDEYEKTRREGHEETNEYMMLKLNDEEKQAVMDWFEENRKEREKRMLEQIETFKQVVNDPAQYARVMEELARRKKVNTEILKSYGIEL